MRGFFYNDAHWHSGRVIIKNKLNRISTVVDCFYIRMNIELVPHYTSLASAKENAAFFTAEARGLSAIAATFTIGTPHIRCTGN